LLNAVLELDASAPPLLANWPLQGPQSVTFCPSACVSSAACYCFVFLLIHLPPKHDLTTSVAPVSSLPLLTRGLTAIFHITFHAGNISFPMASDSTQYLHMPTNSLSAPVPVIFFLVSSIFYSLFDFKFHNADGYNMLHSSVGKQLSDYTAVPVLECSRSSYVLLYITYTNK
jgi:hypothetical protein